MHGKSIMNNTLKKVVYWYSPHKDMRFLNDRSLLLEKDIMVIASVIFNIETAFRMGHIIDEVEIPISSHTAYLCDINKIKQELEALLRFVLIYPIEIRFNINSNIKYKRDKELNFEICKNVCLFSGGIDSFAGIIKTKVERGKVAGIFITHSDQPRGVNIIMKLQKEVLSKENIPLYILHAPPMKRYGYSQLRGFLYCLYGSIYLNLLKAENLFVTECGPTMYQSKFSPFDSVTMTTHPYVLEKTKTIIEILLKRKINIIIPFENLTKSEVFMTSPKKEYFQYTNSCISLGTGRNCGHCYGCIVRKIGSIVAGITEAKYDSDPFIQDYIKADNLISLARFSYDILVNYSSMNFTSKENIFVYKKQRLFRRFALDTFAAIYILKEMGKNTNPHIERLYATTINKIGQKEIQERIKQVRNGRFVPNFDKMVK